MKPIPKFDVSSYVSVDSANPEQGKATISKLAGLANDINENKTGQISQLANHNDESKNLTDEQVIHLLNQATYKTGISTLQFWSFCDEDDIADIYSNYYTLEQLLAYAKSWARYPETVPIENSIPFPDLKPKLVKCKQCKFFIPDKIGDGTGVGNCEIEAEASKKGSLWFNSEKFCDKYKPNINYTL